MEDDSDNTCRTAGGVGGGVNSGAVQAADCW